MPSALVNALAAPIREVQMLVGAGGTGSLPATTLAGLRDALADMAAGIEQAWRGADGPWSGPAAARAADFAAAARTAADALADGADRLGRHTDDAAVAVAAAATRLRGIVERFEARAAALEPHLDEPGIAEQLVGAAHRSLSEAIDVVTELRTELDRRAAAVNEPAPPTAPTAPAGFTGAGLPSGGWGSSRSGLMGVGSPMAAGLGGSPPGRGLGSVATFTPEALETSEALEAGVALADPAAFGDGVAVRLPDGSTVMAPNAVAASAVRHALTQLGVPYQWGGTTPGVGLDCSGLTQWAYREAGLGLPRLAQEQHVGAAVDAGSLRPGDLAVWDGHVAMVVGNGMMIEAGDPVQLSAVRTTNAGQGFHGFFRPTA